MLAEEFGFFGVLLVLTLFLLLVARIMVIGLMAHRNGRPFAGFLAYGASLDNLSDDPVTLEAIYVEPLDDVALGAIYGQSAGKPVNRRIVGRTAP